MNHVCPVCKKRFTTLKGLHRHFKIGGGPDQLELLNEGK